MPSRSESSKQRFEQFARGSGPVPRRNASPFRPVPGRGGPALRRYAQWLRPHVGSLVLLLLLSLLGLAVDLLWPLVSAYLVDQVVLGQQLSISEKTRQILWISLAMATLFTARGVMGWWRSLRLTLLSAKLAFELRKGAFQQVLRLPLTTLNEMKAGGLLSRLSTDVDATTGLLQQALLSPVLALLRLTATLTIVFVLNARIAVILLLVLPPVMLIQASRAGRLRPIWRSMSQDRQDIDGRVSEGIGGVRVVRAFLREKGEERAYMTGHHTVIRKQLLATAIQRRIATVWDLILPMAQLSVLGYGGLLVVRGETSLGVVVAFQGYLWRLFEPIQQIATSISATQRGLAAMDRVFELLDMPRELPDRPEAELAPHVVERIDFNQVGFEYRSGLPVLRDVSLTIRGGQMLALVGVSGAGKTTLTDLLARFADPTSGSIRINGTDLRDLQLRSYRSLLGIVAQDVFLFDGTIRENISYARPDATQQAVQTAATQANADDFIEQLPQGYDTRIGERGVKLSGGQRQRLSIARALLANPQILILDEATSNLDSASERKIQDALQQLLRNRTTVVIAHRLSTISRADCIVVLHEGRVAESGTHQQLLALNGRYREMVERQTKAAMHPLPGP